MRTMYDSVTVDTVPGDATMVAPYIDGLYANVEAFAERFPDATVVTISVIPSHHIGDVYDCERGNGEPSDIPGWVNARRDAGLERPTVYLSRSLLEAGRNACVQVGCPEPDWWIADWTGEPHEVEGAVAVQYLAPEVGAPDNYDVSAVYDDTWHPSGATPAPPGPGPDPSPPGPGPDPSTDPLEVAVASFPLIGPSTEYQAQARKVQALLNCFGNGLAVDGYVGPITEAAIKTFQSAHALAVDGIAGPHTMGALVAD